MRFFNLLTGGLMAGLVLAVPQSFRPRAVRTKIDQSSNLSLNPAQPSSTGHVLVTEANTLNGTGHFPSDQVVKLGVSNFSLPLSFINNYQGSGGQVNAYIQGQDTSGRAVFIMADGNLFYPSSGGSQIPIPIDPKIAIALPETGSTFKMTIKAPIISGRIYFCEGELHFYVVSTPTGDGIVQPSVANLADPSATLMWGFMEFTYLADGTVFANLSFVDFVGMILSLSMQPSDGSPTKLTRSLAPDALEKICNDMIKQSGTDGFPWNRLCITDNGNILRVLSLNSWSAISSNDFGDYYNEYIDQVWDLYSQQPLNISTQRDDIAFSQCSVSDEVLTCTDDNRGYAKPTSADIYGCNSGPFAIDEGDNGVHRANVPRLCAAFHRSTFLLPDGNVQPGPPSSEYYQAETTNYYSKFVHEHELDGMGYAFAYDDVNPSGSDDASGSISSQSPRLMKVFVGGSG